MNPNAKVYEELEHALQFRASGNEGKARVCARRAAGFALANHYRQNGIAVANINAINLLRDYSSTIGLPAPVLSATNLLMQRVNEAYELDGSPDLIACAEVLVDYLFGTPSHSE